MTQMDLGHGLPRRSLLAGFALVVATQPAWAIVGVWRRAAVGTVVVAGAAKAGAAANANANAAASAQAAAKESAAAAKQAEASAKQSAAQAPATASTKTPQQKLAELQSLYDQKLISQADYQAAKAKVLSGLTQ